MTIKQLFGYTADELESMNDEQLTDLLSPLFKFCRTPVKKKGDSELSLSESFQEIARSSGKDKKKRRERQGQAGMDFATKIFKMEAQKLGLTLPKNL